MTLFYAFAQLSVVHLLFLVQIYRFCIVGLDARQLRKNIRRKKKKDKIQNKINVNNGGLQSWMMLKGLYMEGLIFRILRCPKYEERLQLKCEALSQLFQHMTLITVQCF